MITDIQSIIKSLNAKLERRDVMYFVYHYIENNCNKSFYQFIAEFERDFNELLGEEYTHKTIKITWSDEK